MSEAEQPERSDVDELAKIAQDPGEYAKARRLEQLFDLQERVIEKQDLAKELLAFGEVDQHAARSILRQAVEQYIRAAKSIESAEDEDSRIWTWYYQEYDLGMETFHPPEGADAEPVTETVEGLEDVLLAFDPITITWKVKREPPASTMGKHPSGEHREVPETYQLSEETLIAAFEAVNEYLSEIGLDISIEGSEKTDTPL